MAKETTLVMIKPNAVKKNAIGKILDRFESAGLCIAGARLEQLTRERCEGFYAEHTGKPFFEGLVSFMSSGPAMLLALTGENAIAAARELMGDTNPDAAAPGTIRADFADNMTENAVHGSDSPASAERELAYHFEPGAICPR
jgi:nucleoside-diphosphate kinase